MIISNGLPDGDKAAAAALYWDAFGGKLGRVMGPDARAHAYIRRVMQTDHVISAHSPDYKLLGLVGFKTFDGAFVGGTFADLRAIYGLPGAVWRSVFLSLLERDTENTRFLMDGICVAAEARGQGVGTALLDSICAEGRARGYREIRLDVVDTNPRARVLYERQGFRVVNTQYIGPLRHVFGFTRSTTMVKAL